MDAAAFPVLLRETEVVHIQRELWRIENVTLTAAGRRIEVVRSSLRAPWRAFRHSWVRLRKMLKMMLRLPRVFQEILLDHCVFFLFIRQEFYQQTTIIIQSLSPQPPRWTLRISFLHCSNTTKLNVSSELSMMIKSRHRGDVGTQYITWWCFNDWGFVHGNSWAIIVEIFVCYQNIFYL